MTEQPKSLEQRRSVAREVLSLMDLTSLNDDDTEDSVAEMLNRAVLAPAYPAAVCVWPRFIPMSLELLKNTAIRVATVTNFPAGQPNPDLAARETAAAVEAGCHEVDVVFPYMAFMDNKASICRDLVIECCAAVAGKARLKVIIESGMLKERDLIRRASDICLAGGADFIKTSTGKTKVSASLDAAEVMIEAIRDHGSKAGFKAAGGIRTVGQSRQYLNLARKIVNHDWVSPDTFRFGASGLLNDIMVILGEQENSGGTQGY